MGAWCQVPVPEPPEGVPPVRRQDELAGLQNAGGAAAPATHRRGVCPRPRSTSPLVSRGLAAVPRSPRPLSHPPCTVMPPPQSYDGLTQDYSLSPLHRFASPGSKNALHITSPHRRQCPWPDLEAPPIPERNDALPAIPGVRHSRCRFSSCRENDSSVHWAILIQLCRVWRGEKPKQDPHQAPAPQASPCTSPTSQRAWQRSSWSTSSPSSAL